MGVAKAHPVSSSAAVEMPNTWLFLGLNTLSLNYPREDSKALLALVLLANQHVRKT